MSRLFRSEEMSLYQIFFEYDVAYDLTAELGEAGIVEFKNISLSKEETNKYFISEIIKCVEIEERLVTMKNEILRAEIPLTEPVSEPKVPKINRIFDSQRLDTELYETGANYHLTLRDFLKFTELKLILMKTEHIFQGVSQLSSFRSFSEWMSLRDFFGFNKEEAAVLVSQLSTVCGVIIRSKLKSFNNVIWRITLGNVMFVTEDIEEDIFDPETEEIVKKVIFVIIYHGEAVMKKIVQVCNGFQATIYDCPNIMRERMRKKEEVWSILSDLKKVLHEAENQRRLILTQAAKHIITWERKVRKAKAVFHVMNNFQTDKMQKVFIAEFWIPNCKIDVLEEIIQNSKDICAMPPVLEKLEPDPDEMPPTYHRLNKFTKTFQNLVDAYGPNSYKELNPAPFLVVTFPFLFSVMFGDFGHGLIMVILSGFLILIEKSVKKKELGEIAKIFFQGRYLIFLMGLFSLHAGILYNDFFSKSIHIYKSSWIVEVKKHNSSYFSNKTFINMDPGKAYMYHPFPYGIDPIWCLSRDDIVFKNSLKMKMSIIFGIMQMSFGLFLSILNIFYTKKYSEIFTTFIPQIVFLSCLFAYLCVLIFIKWITYGPFEGPRRSAGCAPAILTVFLGVFMFLTVAVDEGCDENMYSYQPVVQRVLFLIAVICIPWLFLVHPVYKIWQKKRRNRKKLHERLIQKCSPTCKARIKGCSELHEPHGRHHLYHHHGQEHSVAFDDDNEHEHVVNIFDISDREEQKNTKLNNNQRTLKTDRFMSAPKQKTATQPNRANEIDLQEECSDSAVFVKGDLPKTALPAGASYQQNQDAVSGNTNKGKQTDSRSHRGYKVPTKRGLADSSTRRNDGQGNESNVDLNREGSNQDGGEGTSKGGSHDYRTGRNFHDTKADESTISVRHVRSIEKRSDETICSIREQRCSLLIQPRLSTEEIQYLDIFIHQAIHAIEFLMGSVSNTASYLRLWALSLAHAELSQVVWNQVFSLALKSEIKYTAVRVIILYLLFATWALLTLAILVLMEGLSAFLHTLRLHWIEFQSKFYEGAGHRFRPFWFKTILRETESSPT